MGGAGGTLPAAGTADGDDDELLAVLDADLAGTSAQGIAEAMFGPERTAAEWEPNGWMRSTVRRRLRKARALANRGYLAIAAGRPVEI